MCMSWCVGSNSVRIVSAECVCVPLLPITKATNARWGIRSSWARQGFRGGVELDASCKRCSIGLSFIIAQQWRVPNRSLPPARFLAHPSTEPSVIELTRTGASHVCLLCSALLCFATLLCLCFRSVSCLFFCLWEAAMGRRCSYSTKTWRPYRCYGCCCDHG